MTAMEARRALFSTRFVLKRDFVACLHTKPCTVRDVPRRKDRQQERSKSTTRAAKFSPFAYAVKFRTIRRLTHENQQEGRKDASTGSSDRIADTCRQILVAIDAECSVKVPIHDDGKVRERDTCHDETVDKEVDQPPEREDRSVVFRGLLHRVCWSGLDTECEGWWSGAQSVDEEDSDGVDWECGQTLAIDEGKTDKEKHDLCNVATHEVEEESGEVGEDAAAFADRGDDGREVVVGEDHLS